MVDKLTVRNVVKNYGSVRALRGVTFSVKKGEYVCILGPTGAGKTTLLKTIAGLVKPDKGQILIDGNDVTELPPEERGVSYMPQGYALFPHMTVWENVAYGAFVKSVELKRAEEALKIVGLYHRRWSKTYELSGGQQQRVALARALAAGSEIILLDEPLSALDVLIATELRYELKDLARELGFTVLHVTHNSEEALSIADRVIILRKGLIQQIGEPWEIYTKPANLFVANFLGEVNVLEGTLKGLREGASIVDVKGFGEIYLRSRIKEGWHVVVVYRSEDIILSREPQSSYNCFKGKVSWREFLGTVTRYGVEVNGIELKVDDYGAPRIEPGSKVYLYFPSEQGFLYSYPREGLVKALGVE